MVRGRYVHSLWTEIEISRFQIDRWLRIAERRRADRAASPGRDRQGSLPAGSTAIAISDKNAARRDPGQEAEIKSRIQEVHAAAQRLCAKAERAIELEPLAAELDETRNYKAETIRQILNGTYGPAKRRGFGPFEWKGPKR